MIFQVSSFHQRVACHDQIIASSSPSSPLTDFFVSFWAAIDGSALSSLDRAATSAAFLSSLLECLVFLIKRIRTNTRDTAVLLLGTQPEGADFIDGDSRVSMLVSELFRRVWEEIVSRRLRVEEAVAGKLLAQTFVSLEQIGSGTSFSSRCVV